MASAIKVSSKELVDVRGYLRILEASREAAAAETQRLNAQCARDMSERIKTLRGLSDEADRLRNSESQRLQRESVRGEITAELSGDLSQEQEHLLLSSLALNEAAFSRLEVERRQREERGAALQEAFAKIRASSGVTSLNHMAQKFLHAPQQRASLERDKLEAERRLAMAKEEYERSLKAYDDLRASGAASEGVGEKQLRGEASLTSSKSTAQESCAAQMAILRQTIDECSANFRILSQVCGRLLDIVSSIHLSALSLDESLVHLRHQFPPALRAMDKYATASNSAPSRIGAETLNALASGEFSLNSVSSVFARASVAYLQSSVSARNTETMLLPFIENAHGKPLGPASVPSADTQPALLADTQLLATAQLVLALPAASGRQSLDDASSKSSDLLLSPRQTDVAQLFTPGATPVLLSLASAASSRMLSTSEAQLAPSTQTSGASEAALAVSADVAPSILCATQSESWRPIHNSDPVMHGNNLRVPPRHGLDRASGSVLVSARLRVNENASSEGFDDEADAGVVTPNAAADDSYAFHRRHNSHIDSSSRDVWSAGSGAGRGGELDGDAPSLRSGIVSSQGYMNAAKKHRNDRDERAQARAAYISSSGNSALIETPQGALSSFELADGDDGMDDSAVSTPLPLFQSSLAGASSAASLAKLSKGGSLVLKSARDKEVAAAASRSVSSTLAAEADPDGLLDRRLIKRLAAAMDSVEERRREAERNAASAKGKIDLQQAMARRASIARLMSDIATSAETAFGAGGGANAAGAGANSTRETGDDSIGGARSVGLEAYTNRPRLR